MAEDGPKSRYVKLTKEQDAPVDEIQPGELNQPIQVPQVSEPFDRDAMNVVNHFLKAISPQEMNLGQLEFLAVPKTQIVGGMALAAATAIFHGIDPRTSFLICEGLFFAWWMCGIYTGLFRQSLQKKYHLKNSPCDPCVVHCCMHWCALCQEHREMKGRLSDNVVMPMTIINPPPVQEMNMGDNREAAASENGVEHTNQEMRPKQEDELHQCYKRNSLQQDSMWSLGWVRPPKPNPNPTGEYLGSAMSLAGKQSNLVDLFQEKMAGYVITRHSLNGSAGSDTRACLTQTGFQAFKACWPFPRASVPRVYPLKPYTFTLSPFAAARMKFRASSPKWPLIPRRFGLYPLSPRHLSSNLFSKSFFSTRVSVNGGPGNGSKEEMAHGSDASLPLKFLLKKLENLYAVHVDINRLDMPVSCGNFFLVPGATVATILMVGVLHARRIYDDKKVEEAKEKGVEFEFSPDAKYRMCDKASTSCIICEMKLEHHTKMNLEHKIRMCSTRFSPPSPSDFRCLELPLEVCCITNKDVSPPCCILETATIAFHFTFMGLRDKYEEEDLEEIALPLEEYSSLRKFFAHALKEGSRPIDLDPYCLVSPVDGTVLRFGELKEPGGLIEQVKGFSYSVSSLLGANSFTPMVIQEDIPVEHIEERHALKDSNRRSWWRISLASPKVRDPISVGPMKGVFYCVIYLKPGDYHRVHSPTDWNVLIRRHFSGHLFPQNERATRTIRNLYVENERVVLEGQWSQGYMAIAAIGATNVGSIELSIEPGLKTNILKWRSLHSDPPDEHVYEPEGVGVLLKKGQEVAAFNMGSTVVLVFQAPTSNSTGKEFTFSVRNGGRIRMGEAIGTEMRDLKGEGATARASGEESFRLLPSDTPFRGQLLFA
ncbi:phosphatidylserine decarboxylase 1 [Asimina triloba]